ncbi:MAG: M23 family metallopeptidase [Acidimicrobiia bacterium]|nr:M23 family metallopeptidase [Acidimicrobiia bacterium]
MTGEPSGGQTGKRGWRIAVIVAVTSILITWVVPILVTVFAVYAVMAAGAECQPAAAQQAPNAGDASSPSGAPPDDAILPATRGRISVFGGRGTGDAAGPLPLGYPGEHGDAPVDGFYVAMRWPLPYARGGAETPGSTEWLRHRRIVVTFRGRSVVGRVADWGPAAWTGRVIDVGPDLMAALGTQTDDTVDIAWAPGNDVPLGPIDAGTAEMPADPPAGCPGPGEGGAGVSADGKYCPVAPPPGGKISFADDWHAPRSGGRVHKGNDLFGEIGWDLVAVTDGVISRVTNTDTGLSGLDVYLDGVDGNTYVYRHNSRNAVSVGQEVRAGEKVAELGNSGNAKGTPPHLHFETKPGGGEPVPPYPFTSAACAEVRS